MFFLAFFFFVAIKCLLTLSLFPSVHFSVRRKGSPSSSWRWQCIFFVGLLMFIISVRLPWQAGLYMTCVMRRAPLLKPFRKPVLNCQNLATWFSYIVIWWNQFEGFWRFDAHQWNSSATCESSRVIIIKSRVFSTGHSACTSKVRDIFWSSDLFTQWLMRADVLECSLTLTMPQFNDGACL